MGRTGILIRKAVTPRAPAAQITARDEDRSSMPCRPRGYLLSEACTRMSPSSSRPSAVPEHKTIRSILHRSRSFSTLSRISCLRAAFKCRSTMTLCSAELVRSLSRRLQAVSDSRHHQIEKTTALLTAIHNRIAEIALIHTVTRD